MTQREQLIQEIEQAPDDLVPILLETLHRLKAEREHPLAKFAGIPAIQNLKPCKLGFAKTVGRSSPVNDEIAATLIYPKRIRLGCNENNG